MMNSEFANISNAAILTTGTFQGHKGPKVTVDHERLKRIVEGSNRFRPLLKEAMQTGELRGNPDFFQRLGKPMPAPISFNHQVLEQDKIRDALKDVEVEFSEGMLTSPEFPDGRPWIFEKFTGVDPLAADMIRRFFQKRSVEIMELTDPDTGERLPAIISTAFLDNATPPAVPGQTDDLYVEFAGQNESHYTLTTEGVTIMADQTTHSPVDVSELQKMKDTLTANNAALAELQAKFTAAENEKAKAIELARQQADEKAALSAKISELQAKQDELDSDKLIAELCRPRKFGEIMFQISPAFQEIAESQIRKNGVIELADGKTARQSVKAMFDGIVELAGKNALLVPLTTVGEKATTRNGDGATSKDDQISELMSEKGISYGDAWELVEGRMLAGEVR